MRRMKLKGVNLLRRAHISSVLMGACPEKVKMGAVR